MAVLTICLIFVANFEYVQAKTLQEEIFDIKSFRDITGSGHYRLMNDDKLLEEIVIDKEWDVTVDLNGKSITSNNRIRNNGVLRLKDTEGTGKFITSNSMALRNEGTMYIDGGYYQTTTVGGAVIFNLQNCYVEINDIIAEARSYAVYNKGGKVLINDGKFNSESRSSTDTFYGYCIANKDFDTSELIIKNAEVTGIQGAVASNTGKITIYDGKFSTDKNKQDSFYALYVAGEAGVAKGEVYGGSFYSPKYAVYIGNDNTDGDGGINADATTSIYDGTFIGDKGAVLYTSNTGKNPDILGGMFSSDVSKYLSSTAVQIKENEIYKVGKKATDLKIDTTFLRLETNASEKITPISTPNDTIEIMEWSSDDSSIASVDKNGTITGHKAGKTSIKVSIGSITKRISIVVYDYDILPSIKPDNTEGVIVEVNDERTSNVLKDTVSLLIHDKQSNYIDEDVLTLLHEAVDEGKNLTANVHITNLKAIDVNEQDRTTINQALSNMAKDNQHSEIIHYLDLSVLLKADGNTLGNIHRLKDELTFTITVDDSLLRDNQTYFVLRIHDGQVTKLPVNRKGNQLEFTTDKFSVFAVGVLENNIDMQYETIGSNDQLNDVNTGDTTNVIELYTTMFLSGLCIIYLYHKSKKKLRS